MNIIFLCSRNVAGPIRAGMSRADIRKILGEYDEFRKTDFSSNTTDDFRKVPAHVYYYNDNIIKGVELFRGGYVELEGVPVFSVSLNVFIEKMKEKGVDYIYEDYGVRIPSAGARIYAPDVESVDDPSIEALYIEMER